MSKKFLIYSFIYLFTLALALGKGICVLFFFVDTIYGLWEEVK